MNQLLTTRVLEIRDTSKRVVAALVRLSSAKVVVPDSGHGTAKLKWSSVGLRALVELTRLPEPIVRGCLEGLSDRKVVSLRRVRGGRLQVQLN